MLLRRGPGLGAGREGRANHGGGDTGPSPVFAAGADHPGRADGDPGPGSLCAAFGDTAKDRRSAFESPEGPGSRRRGPGPQISCPPRPGTPSRRGPSPRQRAPFAPKPRASNRQSMGEVFRSRCSGQAGSTIARELMRGILGSRKKRWFVSSPGAGWVRGLGLAVFAG